MATSLGTGVAAAAKTKERNFVGHIVKVHRHERESTREFRWAFILLQLRSGTRALVELRFVKRSYYLRIGDKVSVVTKNVMPAHKLPCLTSCVPDSLIKMLSAGTIGCVCCPEVYEHAKFDALTELNPEIPIIITREYERLVEGHGVKRQMTFKMLAEEVALRKSERWYAFVSAIILGLDLCKMKDENRLFCGRCQCGNVVIANKKNDTYAETKSCMACNDTVDLRLNSHILAGLADETGGFCNGNKPDEDHAVLLSDLAWKKLLSIGSGVYDGFLTGAAVSQRDLRPQLQAVEEMLVYTRKTFVFCWIGSWGGGRFVIVDML